jgi:hypothetical protein
MHKQTLARTNTHVFLHCRIELGEPLEYSGDATMVVGDVQFPDVHPVDVKFTFIKVKYSQKDFGKRRFS